MSQSTSTSSREKFLRATFCSAAVVGTAWVLFETGKAFGFAQTRVTSDANSEWSAELITANATVALACVAAFSLILSIVGVYLIAQTLSVNRNLISETQVSTGKLAEANDISRRLLQLNSEPRPVCDKVYLRRVSDSNIQVRSVIKNFGGGVVRSHRLQVKSYITNYDFTKMKSYSIHIARAMDINPNDCHWHERMFFNSNELGKLLREYDAILVIRIKFLYEDGDGVVQKLEHNTFYAGELEVGEEFGYLDARQVEQHRSLMKEHGYPTSSLEEI